MKNALSKATGCFSWLLSSQRTHLGIEVEKNVSSAGAFHFSIWHISLVPKPWRKCPPRAGGKRSRCCLGPVFPALSSRQPACRERGLGRHRGLSVGVRQGFSTTMACSHLVSGSCTASLRLFCAVPAHSSWEAGHFKRSEMTLILCFQKAHRQNVDPYGCMDPAYQLR